MTILVHTCPHCLTERMSMAVGQQSPGPAPAEIAVPLMCSKCRKPSCALLEIDLEAFGDRLGAGRSSMDANQIRALAAQRVPLPGTGDPLDHGWRIKQFWPELPKPSLPENLPSEVAKPFLAAERNYPQADMEEASAGSYRRALDVGTKLIAATLPNAAEYERQQLNNRIDKLRKDGKLTQDLADWSHQIKGLGNEAMHDLDGVTREELTALRGFTELVLTYLFTLPGMLAERKAEVGKAKT